MSQMFQLLKEADTPTVIGKAWWNEALKLSKQGDGRRTLLTVGAVMGAVMIGPPFCAGVVSAIAADDDDTRRERRRALEAQRAYGWSFGATDEAGDVGGYGNPVDAAELDALTTTLAPKNPRWRPLWVPTLFESISARPTATLPAEDVRAAGFKPLRDVVRASLPGTAATAALAGRFLADALRDVAGVAVVVDLPGPDAVGFASALAGRFDPVFLFDNWPHPRGVVRSHETLAATLALLPELKRAKEARLVEAPPVFVLDRDRLAPYSDEATQFDNRSLARLPPLAPLQAAGIRRVFYVAPANAVPFDKDDVVDDLVAWRAAGIDVRGFGFDVTWAVAPSGPTSPFATFARHYGLPLPPGETASETPPPGASYVPAPRSSPFSSHHAPSGFGEVPVVVDVATGALLGAALYRNGSWNRAPASSTYFGGG